jgi:predicted nucleotidyltransferase
MTAYLVKNINLPMPQIREFCDRWQIVEFALFGSVLRDDFRTDSDIDCLVSFQADSPWSLLDLVQMQIELEQIFTRKVDLLSKSAIERSENWIRRQEILSTAQNIYSKSYALK